MMPLFGNIGNRIKNLREFELSEFVINGRIFEWHFTKKNATKRKTSEVIDLLMRARTE